MTDALVHLDPFSKLSLQSQIRQKLVDASLQGIYPARYQDGKLAMEA